MLDNDKDCRISLTYGRDKANHQRYGHRYDVHRTASRQILFVGLRPVVGEGKVDADRERGDDADGKHHIVGDMEAGHHTEGYGIRFCGPRL